MASDPEQAVLDHIAGNAPTGRQREPALNIAQGGRVAPQRSAWTAIPGTVQILKERRILGRRVYVVGFDADHVRAGRVSMTMIVRAERVAGLGWVARGIGAAAVAEEPRLDEPRVLLSGSWGGFGFCGGGRLCGPDAPEIERVRLHFGNGVVLEDGTDGGWVVFFTDSPVERPEATLDLLDADGDVVASHEWPALRDLPEALRRRIPVAVGRHA